MILALDGSRQLGKNSANVKRILGAAIAVLDEYNQDGFDVTLRQLFYRLVSDLIFANTKPNYRNLGRYINAAKESGQIDWNWVEDRTRYLRGRKRYQSTREWLAYSIKDWHQDYWEGQKLRPEVWIEKDALLSIIAPVCDEYDVEYYSCRGWSSPSDIMELAQRFAYSKQHCVLLHAGDYDPTGCWVTEHIRKDLARYMSHLMSNGDEYAEVRRIGLTKEQIQHYGLPPNLIGDDGESDSKKRESRLPGFIAANGGCRNTWELDALRPAQLQEIIRTEIEACITNRKAWNTQQGRIQHELKKLKNLEKYL